MTQKQFLRSLNRKLWWDVTGTERKETISSYQKFFAENSGRDEAELVAECGDIGLIADEILVEYGQMNHPLRRFLAVSILWFFACWTSCNYWILTHNLPDEYLLPFISFILLPFVTTWIIGGKKLSFKHLPSTKFLMLFFLAGAIGTAVIVVAIEFLVKTSLLASTGEPISYFALDIWHIYEAKQIGELCAATLESTALLVGLFACFASLMAIRRNIYFLTALPFCSGVLLFVLEHDMLLASLDTSQEDVGEIIRLIAHLAYRHIFAGFVCTLLLALAIFLRRKVRKW